MLSGRCSSSSAGFCSSGCLLPSSPTIFRRHDISGWGKAGWTALVFVLPILGILIYMHGGPAGEIGR
ncbi:MAG: PLDc N-terminal domain-containing protein [Actinomycetota bacterium]